MWTRSGDKFKIMNLSERVLISKIFPVFHRQRSLIFLLILFFRSLISLIIRVISSDLNLETINCNNCLHLSPFESIRVQLIRTVRHCQTLYSSTPIDSDVKLLNHLTLSQHQNAHYFGSASDPSIVGRLEWWPALSRAIGGFDDIEVNANEDSFQLLFGLN